MEKSDNIRELLELREAYSQEKEKMSDIKGALAKKKKDIYNQVIEHIQSEIDTQANSPRLQRYLESTKTQKFDFLYRSIHFTSTNNQKGNLSFYDLLLLNEEVQKIGQEYGITSKEKLWKVLSDYNYYRKQHPFLENDRVNEIMLKVPTLAYLDEIFKDINNVLAYQGSYTVYQYVKSYLREVLKEGLPETDDDLIYKDFEQKIEIVLSNLSSVATYLLNIRDQIPNSKLAICNHGLSRTARKIEGTGISQDQKVFAKSIAFGTTLEKLQDGNYEDAKSLIFIPHQNLFK